MWYAGAKSVVKTINEVMSDSGGDKFALGVGNTMGTVTCDEKVLSVAHFARFANFLA